MNIGDKILKYRKLKGYSQEDIANSLNVSRQTVSKWETNQSTPDFNKIIPLCKLFGISADILLDMEEMPEKGVETINEVSEKEVEMNTRNTNSKNKFAILVSISIFLYFLAVMGIIIGDELGIPDGLNVSIFLGIVGVATTILIYNGIVNGKDKRENYVEEKNKNKKAQEINNILALGFCAVYLFISFTTMAWNITWIIWIVYACVAEIIKSIFRLGE